MGGRKKKRGEWGKGGGQEGGGQEEGGGTGEGEGQERQEEGGGAGKREENKKRCTCRGPNRISLSRVVHQRTQCLLMSVTKNSDGSCLPGRMPNLYSGRPKSMS